jgi:single-strand DNA-binding protein
VYVEGKLQSTSWQDRQSGERKYRTEIVARDLLLLSPRENSGGDHQRPTHNENDDQPSHAGSGEIVDEDFCTSLRRESCHDPSQRTRQ